MKRTNSILLLLLFCGVSVFAADIQYKTFRSPGVKLRSGQVANTPGNFGPLDWINEPIAIKHFSAKAVDADGNDVPLSELYVHHWLIYNNNEETQNKGLCVNLPNIWGIGAELVHTQYDYPDPYAIVTEGNEVWTTNLHFIRTTNVPDVQMCIECHCADANLPTEPHGSIDCCPDRSMCWGMENSTIEDSKEYFLQYTIGYVPITDDIIPLTVYSMDATATVTYDCQIEHQIPALKPNEVSVLESFSTAPVDWGIVFFEVHQHIGGLNYTAEHYRDGKNLGTICSVSPTYGSGGLYNPGNETGYVVGIPTCIFPKPYEVKAGDQLKFTSVYGPRTIAGGHPWHEGVMSLVFIAATATQTDEQRCMAAFHSACGEPPYASGADCLSCAKQYRHILENSKCTVDLIEHECSKNTEDGNVPVPDSLNGALTLHIKKKGDSLTMNFTGPTGSWFGVGINPVEGKMNSSDAWVYVKNEDSELVLQHRKLGDHFQGTLIDADYPHEISTVDGVVNLFFNVSVPLPDTTCFIFAHGTDMTLAYHGTTRGPICNVFTPTKELKTRSLEKDNMLWMA
eukprot:CAMPEP_0174251646 /NCGR_PEP_ID=MMETSP0439-20130205/1393_1 /TAXON_ID=0 /ORGANISM="Stereomyxa ramosa, Strain Chinc5" /LENGTH=567 /DNA_ID=CAMNT_0015332007 /DNA_START=11 /DNA_END=1714 /DNA_ORIENTATION=-